MTFDNTVSSTGYHHASTPAETPMPPKSTLIGRGVYSIAEAARLLRIQRDAITRWTRGYSYTWKGERRTAAPVFQSRLRESDVEVYLDFADLMEVGVLAQFRRYGVSWRSIRICAARVAEIRSSSHPFSARDFKTDGRSILLEMAPDTRDPKLLNLVSDQFEFRRVVQPLLKRVEYEGETPVRWWPTGKRDIVVDPMFAFGAPIVHQRAIRTRVLADCYEAEGSYRAAAWWYEVPERLVKAAVAFEFSLAA